MPWEKSFDEDEAIGKAMRVFWEKGYEPASISDLIAGIGITRGSLYNAFGGKEQLFIKSLLKYDKDYRRALLTEMEALDDPKRAIKTLFDLIVADTVADPDRKGCFIVNTTTELSTHGDEVNTIIRTGLREFETFFRRSIEVAQTRNEIPASVDPKATAKALLGLMISIRVLGRGMYDKASLRIIADQAQRLLAA